MFLKQVLCGEKKHQKNIGMQSSDTAYVNAHEERISDAFCFRGVHAMMRQDHPFMQILFWVKVFEVCDPSDPRARPLDFLVCQASPSDWKDLHNALCPAWGFALGLEPTLQSISVLKGR